MPDPFDALRVPVIPIEPRPAFARALLRRLQGAEEPAARASPTVRYFVDDVDAAIAFYCGMLGFEKELRPSPAFAMLYRGALRLLLSTPDAAHALPDGTPPRPGGWNCLALRVDDLRATVDGLRARGAAFRTEIATSVAVYTATLEDPAGNPVELFEPRSGYHERGE